MPVMVLWKQAHRLRWLLKLLAPLPVLLLTMRELTRMAPLLLLAILPVLSLVSMLLLRERTWVLLVRLRVLPHLLLRKLHL